MSKTKRKSVRFCVGDVDGLRGSTWVVSVNGNDVFVASDPSSSVRKASLHPSGKWQEAFNFEYAQSHNLIGPRWSERWLRPEPLGAGVTLAFRIMVPTSELAEFHTVKDRKQTIWVSAAPQNHYVEFQVLLVENPDSDRSLWPGKQGSGSRLVGRLALEGGSEVFITYTTPERVEGDDWIGTELTILRLYCDMHLAEMGGSLGSPRPGLRQMAIAHAPDGSRIYLDCQDSRTATDIRLPDSVDGWLDLGARLAKSGSLGLAREAFQRASTGARTADKVERNLAALAIAETQTDLQVQYNFFSYPGDQSEPVQALNQAVELAAEGRSGEALALLGPLCDSSPVRARALHNRCVVLGHLGRWDEALADERLAITLVPNDGNLHAEASKCLARLGQHVEAEYEIRDAIRHDTENWQYRVLLGRYLAEKGDHDGAISEFDSAMWMGADSSAIKGKILCLLHLRQDESALEAIRVALRRWPDDFDLQRIDALALSRLGRHIESENRLRALADRCRAAPGVLALRALELLETGQGEEALKVARQAIALDEDWLGTYTLGRALLENGEFHEAKNVAGDLISIDSMMPDAWYMRAAAEAELGDFDASLQSLTQAIARGWTDRAHLREDPHFDTLRRDKRAASRFEALAADN